jgi:hypothetical protein
MQANNAKHTRSDECSPMRSVRSVRKVPRATFLISTFFVSGLMLASFGCAPTGGGKQPSGSASTELPELTEEMIRERISYAAVRDIPEENGTSQPITWRFFQSEPKEIAVVEKQVEGERATIVLDIKTSSSPRSREQRYLAGQIRTEWELRTGWVLRQWEIVKTENISMKYRNLPKPTAQNSNR